MYFWVEYFCNLIRIRSLLWSEILTVAVQSIRISERNIDQIFNEIKYYLLKKNFKNIHILHKKKTFLDDSCLVSNYGLLVAVLTVSS